MLNPLLRKFIQFFTLIFLTLGLSISFQSLLAAAWQSPTNAPASPNVPPPINTSFVDQVKGGGLGIGGLLFIGNTGSFAIQPGAGNGKVLTSDNVGNSSWQPAVGTGLTVNRALVSNASGKVSVSGVTNTELGFLSGVTSGIQAQLNAKAPSNSPTFTGNVTMPGNGIWNSSGNVGIGTLAPAYKLDVNGLANIKDYLLINNKYVVDGTDSYLRLNQQGSFGSGVYTPGNLRTDGIVYTNNSFRFLGDASTLMDSNQFYCNNGSNCHFNYSGTGLTVVGNGAGVYTPGNIQATGIIYAGSSFRYNGSANTIMDSNQFYCNNSGSCYYNHSGSGLTVVGNGSGLSVPGSIWTTGIVYTSSSFRYNGSANTIMDSNQFYCNNSGNCHYNYSGTGQTHVGNSAGTWIYGTIHGNGSGLTGVPTTISCSCGTCWKASNAIESNASAACDECVNFVNYYLCTPAGKVSVAKDCLGYRDCSTP